MHERHDQINEISTTLLAHNQHKQIAWESSHVNNLYAKGNQNHGSMQEKEKENSKNQDSSLPSLSLETTRRVSAISARRLDT